jgi:hypothetical protein
LVFSASAIFISTRPPKSIAIPISSTFSIHCKCFFGKTRTQCKRYQHGNIYGSHATEMHELTSFAWFYSFVLSLRHFCSSSYAFSDRLGARGLYYFRYSATSGSIRRRRSIAIIISRPSLIRWFYCSGLSMDRNFCLGQKKSMR